MPINKQIWTPSFVVFCAGMALLGLGTFFYIIDVLGHELWARPFVIYGMNALAAFVLSAIVGRALPMIRFTDHTGEVHTLRGWLTHHAAMLGDKLPFGNVADNESLAFAIGYVLFFFILMWVMYRL